MSTNEILQVTNLIQVFVSFLFAYFLVTVKSTNKTGNIILAIFLIIRAIDASAEFYYNLLPVHPKFDILRHDLSAFSQAPLLYLFVLSIIYSNFRIKTIHLLHSLPFFLSTLMLFPRFYLQGGDQMLLFWNNYTSSFEGKFTYILAHLQILAYLIATFWVLFRYRKILKENYSFSGDSNFNWLIQMNIICCLLFITILFKNLYRFGDHYGYIDGFRLAVSLIKLAFISWLVLKAMYAPKIFRGVDANLQLVSHLIGKENRTTKELSQDKTIEKQIIQLRKYMETEEPFLNPNLSIKDLEEPMKISTTQLSILINHHLHVNFYNFINQYRIEKAKYLLSHSTYKQLTILEILYEVGFNSKSSFNTSFRKQTGLTPSQYRKKYLPASKIEKVEP